MSLFIALPALIDFLANGRFLLFALTAAGVFICSVIRYGVKEDDYLSFLGAIIFGIFAACFVVPKILGKHYLSIDKVNWTDLVPIAIIFLINLIFKYLLKAPSKERERQLLAKMAGFKMHLTGAYPIYFGDVLPIEEADEYFKKCLPYAAALDMEDEWVKRFPTEYALGEMPEWEDYLKW